MRGEVGSVLEVSPTIDSRDENVWSQNRKEVPEGTYCHETALSLHELSDVMPSKLQMIVPKHFRRNSRIPEILELHRADLAGEDVQEMHGVRATRPLRTIADVTRTGRVDRSQLRKAVEEALRRGLFTRKQIDAVRHRHAKLAAKACRAAALMDETKQYKTAGAFRAALEARLQTRAE